MSIRVILEKKKKKDPVGEEIEKQLDKGKDHDQAVAIALSKEEEGTLEEELLDEKRKKRKKRKKKKKKKKGKKDACYHKVRARYDVWPSAYASGALVKCRKVGAANWGNKSKTNEEIEKEIELDLDFLQEVDELMALDEKKRSVKRSAN